jgi:hypothetical protein
MQSWQSWLRRLASTMHFRKLSVSCIGRFPSRSSTKLTTAYNKVTKKGSSFTIDKQHVQYTSHQGDICQVNTKIAYKGYEISLALDDSCGNPKELFRGDFLIFKDYLDVTVEFFPDYTSSSIICATGESLHEIVNLIDQKVG